MDEKHKLRLLPKPKSIGKRINQSPYNTTTHHDNGLSEGKLGFIATSTSFLVRCNRPKETKW